MAPWPPAPDLLGMPFDRLQVFLEDLGVGAGHAPRVFRALHVHDVPLDGVTGLGRHAATITGASWRAPARLAAVDDSGDGTRKLLFELGDGARVEAVLIPMRADRATLCVSTQVGCAMGCSFCATGTLGLARGLRAGEVVAQVHAARRLLEGSSQRVRNVVFMGMGEPFADYDATSDALRVLLDDHGPGFAARHFTVSTVGFPRRIVRFLRDHGRSVQLALSMHAGTDATRRALIPSATRWDLATLKRACTAVPLPRRQKLMVEVVVLPGVNDSPEEVDGIADWMDGVRGVVNLIPFNPFPGAAYRTPTDDEVLAVYDRLQARRVPATIRWPRGRGAGGACGQLALLSGSAAVSPPGRPGRAAVPRRPRGSMPPTHPRCP